MVINVFNLEDFVASAPATQTAQKRKLMGIILPE